MVTPLWRPTPGPGGDGAVEEVRVSAGVRLATVAPERPTEEGEELVPTPAPGPGLGLEEPVDTIILDGTEVPVPQGQRVDLAEGMGFLTVRLQALFPYQYEDPPRFLTHGDVAWPSGVDFISRGSRYVYWALEFDDSEAVDGWVKDLRFRWVDDQLFAETGKVMLETPTQARDGNHTIYLGVGRAAPGFWRAGNYTVYLLDGEFQEVLSSSFEVR